MTPEHIVNKLKDLKVPQSRIAKALGGVAQPQASRLLKGERSIKAHEITPLMDLIAEFETGNDSDPTRPNYVAVEVLPTFAGAGGGGTGEGEARTALIPRYLVVDELHGKPDDFLLIDIRGDSMEPDFYQGDQVLVDKRDTSPAQPGPFAVWDGEWGEYLVKNVERSAGGQVRIFSSNKKYSDIIVAHEATRIIGRPVWVGRRL